MSLRIRQLIFLALSVIFFVLAPLLILYTAGYRYDFKKRTLEKTGTLILDSVPDRAKIFINDKDTGKTTPSRFPHILPDNYLVRLEKNGFHAWEKILAVESKHTAFATDILFFRSAAPEADGPKNIKLIKTDNDASVAALVAPTESWGELWVWDFKKKPAIRFKSASKISEMSWSPNGKNLLVKTQSSNSPAFFVVPKDAGGAIALSSLTGYAWENIIWDEENEHLLYGASPLGSSYIFYSINLESGRVKKIGWGGPTIWQQGDRLYSLSPVKNEVRVTAFPISGKGDLEQISVLKKGKYSFVRSPSNLLTLVDPETARLYVLEADSEGPPLLEERSTYALWSNSFRRLLLSDDFEINVYEPEKNMITFITRYGQPIKKALWMDSEAHIVLEFDNSILGLELDSRGTRYSPTLVSGNGIADLFLSEDGRSAYFTAAADDGRRLFALPIR